MCWSVVFIVPPYVCLFLHLAAVSYCYGCLVVIFLIAQLCPGLFPLLPASFCPATLGLAIMISLLYFGWRVVRTPFFDVLASFIMDVFFCFPLTLLWSSSCLAHCMVFMLGFLDACGACLLTVPFFALLFFRLSCSPSEVNFCWEEVLLGYCLVLTPILASCLAACRITWIW